MQFWQFILIQVWKTNFVIFTTFLLETKLIAVLKSLNGQFGIALHPNYICSVISLLTFRNTHKCQTFPTFKTFKTFFHPSPPSGAVDTAVHWAAVLMQATTNQS